jgi:hypothetical protein
LTEKNVSYQIGIDTIHLRPTPRLAHTEYCDSEPLIRAVTGEAGAEWNTPAFNDAWEIDLQFVTHDGPVLWSERGRTTDMGHAEFLDGGRDFRAVKPCPFKSAAEVWAFDAVREYGLPDMDKLVAYYEKYYRDGQAANPRQVFTGGYYKTIVSGAIDAFGWDMLLEAAADAKKFERTLDSIFRLSLHNYTAWARTSIEVFICHDDMVWSQGPFIRPDFYRGVIFPRYRELWSILKKAGKKVLYCSDGNYSTFVDDIAAAGADGFIFEPMMALDPICEKYGQTHVIIGSKVDCRIMTLGATVDIQAEIDATLALAMHCPGFMFAVGNHLPANIPIENGLFYFDYLKRHWKRK